MLLIPKNPALSFSEFANGDKNNGSVTVTVIGITHVSNALVDINEVSVPPAAIL